jgi:hypothetical protein
MAMSEVCQIGAVGFLSRSRILFRNDLIKVKACFHEQLVMHHQLGKEILDKGFQINSFLISLLKHEEKVTRPS